MMHVYCSRFSSRFSSETVDRLATSVVFDPRFLLRRYRRWQDAQAHLIGRLLIARGLAAYGVSPAPPLRYSDDQRPYVDLPVDFSISHSGEYVVCVIADDRRVGVDIERIRPIVLADMQLSFSPAEWQAITTAPDPHQQLFDYWTRKEAVAKADGRGMPIADRIVLNGSQARVEETSWFVSAVTVATGYRAYLASSKPIVSEVDCTTVTFD